MVVKVLHLRISVQVVYFVSKAKVFNSQSASMEEIYTAGEKILVNLYNGKPDESLNSMFIKDSAERWCSVVTYKTMLTLLRVSDLAYPVTLLRDGSDLEFYKGHSLLMLGA